jgi:hypothetical protein
MKKNYLLALLLLTTSCWGQDLYTLPLAKANTALSLPVMTAGGGALYEAHRSFDLLRFSNQLQVSAFDLATHKELRHTVVNVPRVHGARAADGFFLSADGQTLVYAEIYEPKVMLVLSAKDLSEIRRTDALPFTTADRHRLFAGFDERGLLSFASERSDMLRFVRINPSDFKIASEVTGPKQFNAEPIVWWPKSQTTWVQLPSGAWQEYHEDGSRSEAKLDFHFMHGADNGAMVLGVSKLLAFYGNFSDQGAVAVYSKEHTGELELKCVPHRYSSGHVPEYAGAICTTSPDREPENGGNKILSSEFLLLKADGPTIAWRHSMDFLSVADSNDTDTGRQWGNPLLYRTGSKLLIVAPSKSPALTVYEVALPKDSSVASAE